MKSRPRRPFLNKLAIIFVPILMIGFSLFMWAWQVEPRRVETVTAAMEMPQWKRKEGPPLRIAIAGDFHLRPNGGDLAHKYMETIMEARPDMIFLLGDYANGHTRESSMAPETAREYFKMLKAPLGIFAVQGNHDQYYGWNLWRNMFSGLGILPMWNDSLLLHLPGAALFRQGRLPPENQAGGIASAFFPGYSAYPSFTCTRHFSPAGSRHGGPRHQRAYPRRPDMPSRRQGPGKHLTREGQIFLSLVPAERNSLPHYPRFGMQRSSPALLLPSGNHRAGNPIRNNYPDNAPSPHALYFLFTLYLHIVHNNMCSHVSEILLHASRGSGTRGRLV